MISIEVFCDNENDDFREPERNIQRKYLSIESTENHQKQ